MQGIYCEDLEQIRIKDPDPRPEPPEIPAPAQILHIGAFYALHEHGAYWLVKVLHQEKGLVHYLRYARPSFRIPSQVQEDELCLGLDPDSLSFGAEHLTLAEAKFLAQARFIQQAAVSSADIQGYNLYVDSLLDCFHQQAPDWLQTTAFRAAWHNDRRAMIILVDRYLLGAELPKDSKKALYWINRLVQQELGRSQAGAVVTRAEDILIGGLYGWKTELGTYTVGKVVLQDQEGVQHLSLNLRFEALPDPLKLQEALAPGEALVHRFMSCLDFIQKKSVFLGLFPITVAELHCYRNYLVEAVPALSSQPSVVEHLQQRAEAGEAAAQYDLALVHLHGDPVWEVDQDIPTALHWFTQAANQGHGLAAYELALLSQRGADCMAPDPQLSLEWLLYAARLNCGLAQYQAGEHYMQAQDRVQAHAWYSIALSAAENGLESAEYEHVAAQQERLAEQMSAQDLAQAGELVPEILSTFLSDFSHES